MCRPKGDLGDTGLETYRIELLLQTATNFFIFPALHPEFVYALAHVGHGDCTLVGAAFLELPDLGNQATGPELVVPHEERN